MEEYNAQGLMRVAMTLMVSSLCVKFEAANGSVVQILDDISFNGRRGEILSLIGESGCGKTTVLKAIARLVPISSGKAEWLESGAHHQCVVSYLQYDAPLMPFRTVLHNACLGFELAGSEVAKKLEKVADLLIRLRLGDFLNHLPSQISGGMRQRVAFVQAIGVQPDLLLLDEPFSFQDRVNQAAMEETVFREIKESSIACIVVTHDLEAAAAVADDVIIMGAQPGRVSARLRVPHTMTGVPPNERRSLPAFDEWADAVWHEVRHARHA